ncbi:MAG: hypothetical protein AB7L71_02590 [Vicinamibacterales bacterium]
MKCDLKSRAAVLALAAIGLLSAAAARAQPKSFDDWKIELEAQSEILTKQLQLRELQSRMAGPAFAGLPTVLAVVGLDGRLSARIQQGNGNVSTYAEGDTIRSGMVVASITPRQVTLKVGQGKSAKAIPLEFAPGAVMSPAFPGAAPGLPAGMPGMPGLPGGAVPADLLPPPPAIQLPQPAPLRAQSGNVPAAAAAAPPAAPAAPVTAKAPSAPPAAVPVTAKP